MKRERSLLALGGALLAWFAFVFATVTLAISAVAQSPLILVFPFLFGPLALAGGILAGLGRRRVKAAPQRLRGARTGAMGMVGAGLTLLAVLPVALYLGLPRFRAYQLDSREQQALHFLSQLRMGAVSYRHASPDRVFPPGDDGWTPPMAPTSRRYAYDAALWRTEPWASLDFAPSTAHFHQYRYRRIDGGRGFVVEARGDLDGDGRLATYTSTVRVGLDGRVERSGPVRAPEDTR